MSLWLLQLGLRSLATVLSGRANRTKPRKATQIRMISILSMPRTGSTLAKRYLGAFDAVEIAPLQHFEKSLEQARNATDGRLLLDKKTDNIKRLHQIIPAIRGEVGFVCLVRDPRDELLSLSETDRHRPVPRDGRFWPYWVHRYRRALKALRRLSGLGVPVALVRYEDLATHPVEVKRSFLEWLSLDPRELDENYDTVTGDESISSREDWKAHQHSRVHDSSVGRWKSASGEVRAAIEAHRQYRPARRLMRKLGYVLDESSTTGSVRPLDFADFRGFTVLTDTNTAAPSAR
jgi:hypothetical protein